MAESDLLKVMSKQPLDEQIDNLPVLDGQERLATQAERDEVNEKIEGAVVSHDRPYKGV
jgi:hypothetical protein